MTEIHFQRSAELDAFWKWLEPESPRGRVVVAAVYFEQLLKSKLGVTGNQDFYTSITQAFQKGLLTRDERDDLTILRRLRNQFAQFPSPAVFDAERTRDVDQLKLWIAATQRAPHLATLLSQPEQRWLYVAAAIDMRLRRRSLRLKRGKEPQPGPLAEPPFDDAESWPAIEVG
jgi:hypothetical protein